MSRHLVTVTFEDQSRINPSYRANSMESVFLGEFLWNFLEGVHAHTCGSYARIHVHIHVFIEASG